MDGTHSLASFIMVLVFCIGSFDIASLVSCIALSLHARASNHCEYWHLAACLCVRHGTHSFVSLILSAVFSIVSFIIVSFTVVSLLMIDSLLHTRDGRRRLWMACTTCVVLMKAARISGGWRVRLGSIRILHAPVARRPTVSQWPVTRARQPA